MRRPKATDLGWKKYKRVEDRNSSRETTFWLSIAIGCLALVFGYLLLYAPSIARSEGVVTVNRVIASTGGGRDYPTWTLTFLEKSTTLDLVNHTEPTYNVIYSRGPVQPGQRFELLLRHDGRYMIRKK